MPPRNRRRHPRRSPRPALRRSRRPRRARSPTEPNGAANRPYRVRRQARHRPPALPDPVRRFPGPPGAAPGPRSPRRARAATRRRRRRQGRPTALRCSGAQQATGDPRRARTGPAGAPSAVVTRSQGPTTYSPFRSSQDLVTSCTTEREAEASRKRRRGEMPSHNAVRAASYHERVCLCPQTRRNVSFRTGRNLVELSSPALNKHLPEESRCLPFRVAEGAREPTRSAVPVMAADSSLALSLDEPLLDVEQAAALLAARPSWVRDATRAGRLPCLASASASTCASLARCSKTGRRRIQGAWSANARATTSA